MNVRYSLIPFAFCAALVACSGGAEVYNVDAGIAQTDAKFTVDAMVDAAPDACVSHARTIYIGSFPRAYYLNLAASPSGYMATAREWNATYVRSWMWNLSGELRLDNQFPLVTASTSSDRPINFIMGTADGGYLASVGSSSTQNQLVRLNNLGDVTQHAQINPGTTQPSRYGTSASDGEWVSATNWNSPSPNLSLVRFGKVEANATVSAWQQTSLPTFYCDVGIARIGQVTGFAGTYFDATDHSAKINLIRKGDLDGPQEVLLAPAVPTTGATCRDYFEVLKFFSKDNNFVVLWEDRSTTNIKVTVVPATGTSSTTFPIPLSITDLVPVEGGYLASYRNYDTQVVGAILLDNNFEEVNRWEYPTAYSLHEPPQIVALDNERFMLAWIDNNDNAQVRIHGPSCNN